MRRCGICDLPRDHEDGHPTDECPYGDGLEAGDPNLDGDGPLFRAGHVLEAKTGGYLVLSRTTPGCWWLVFERSCSCPAGRSGAESCWHRRRVAEFVRLLDESMKRPVAPVNVSAMVD